MRHIILGMCLALLSIGSLSAQADHRDRIDFTPVDEWDYGAREGAACGYYQACMQGLTCLSDGYSDRGTCRKPCYSGYDCKAGQYCTHYGYCQYGNDGGYNPPGGGGGYYPPHGGEDGQRCSIRGTPYPRCSRHYTCYEPRRDGYGVCKAKCRSSRDCGYGDQCIRGTCLGR